MDAGEHDQPSQESAMEAITSDARNQDGSPHETAPTADGPRDRAEPDELTVSSADGDSDPRLEQKQAGDF
jgi:hypothetical protein